MLPALVDASEVATGDRSFPHDGASTVVTETRAGPAARSSDILPASPGRVPGEGRASELF